MDLITRFGLEKTRFTVLMMLLILALGIASYLTIPKREDPEITIRTAVVAAAFDGMAPTRVEELIAVPIERKLREIGEIEDIEAIVRTGEVLLYVTLYDGVATAGIAAAWEDLRNKMAEVHPELPDGTSQVQVNTDYGDVAIATVAITGDGFSLAEIEDVAEDLRTALFRVAGISKVSFHGVQEERVWLEVDIRKLAAMADMRTIEEPSGRVEQRDLWKPYAKHVRHFLRAGGSALEGKKIKAVVDASNAMAGTMLPNIFGEKGEAVEAYLPGLELITLNMDNTSGEFAHPPNPLVKSNMRMTQEAVMEHKADVGFCFDGDADRCMVVDDEAQIVG